jgi:hypothetical protein
VADRDRHAGAPHATDDERAEPVDSGGVPPYYPFDLNRVKPTGNGRWARPQ